MNNGMDLIVEELKTTARLVDETMLDKLTEAICRAPVIFLAGAGRSGLMVKAFAMRLMHLGKTAHIVGDVTAPALQKGNLLIIGSGSGETGSLVCMAEKAKKIGADIAVITLYPASSIAKMADYTIQIAASTTKSTIDTGYHSRQPMGSLFEQSELIVFDSIIMKLMELYHVSEKKMAERHANLE